MKNLKKKQKVEEGGGANFPRLDLSVAIEYSKKLAVKTHTGPQARKIILPGVFGSVHDRGIKRATSLKQFGLMKGEDEFEATEESKIIYAAPENEATDIIRKVCLTPPIFESLYKTFSGDTVTRAKIRQQASQLKVHPESLDECVSHFINSLEYAKLATTNGDDVSIIAFSNVPPQENKKQEEAEGEKGKQEEAPPVDNKPKDVEANLDVIPRGQPKSNIDIKIDPAMDPEKLEKLLAVLRKYGQI